jgi:hypothetical protein
MPDNSLENTVKELANDMAELRSMVAQMVKATTTVKPKRKPRAKPKNKNVRKKTTTIDKSAQQVDKKKTAGKIISLVHGNVNRGQSVDVTRGNKSKTLCRIEPMTIIDNRPNLFLKSGIQNSFKQDSLIDKKLSGNVKPVPRRSTAVMYEVACNVCGKIEIVSPNMIMEDEDTKEIKYTCDGCIRR